MSNARAVCREKMSPGQPRKLKSRYLEFLACVERGSAARGLPLPGLLGKLCQAASISLLDNPVLRASVPCRLEVTFGTEGTLTGTSVNEGFVKNGAHVPASDTSASAVAMGTSCT